MPTTIHTVGSLVAGRGPKYKVISELGRGGMACVYLALARGLAGFSKLVVLKCIRPELAWNSEFLTMFTDEARLAACLNHPNIVQTNEILERDGAPVIVMEHLEGRTLAEILRRAQREQKPLPIPLHLHILLEVLRGLHYAHEATDLNGKPLNLVHRDITPQNIMVTYRGQVKIFDFGIAKSADASQETMAGVLKGKLRYMAPEQLVTGPVDRRADVFSVGVLLWQAVAGRPLWRDMAEADVIQAVLTGQFPSPRSENPYAPFETDEILAHSLRFRACDRFPSARAFEQALSAVVARLGPRVGPRELEVYMDELFAVDREEGRALVARARDSIQETSFTGTGEIAFPSRLGEDGPPRTSSVHSKVFIDTAPRGRRRRLRRWGVVLAILALGGAAIFERAREEAMSFSRSEATEAPTAQHPPAKIRVMVTPSKARIFWDDRILSSNPYEAVMPPDDREHVVRAELEGYAPREEKLVFNGNVFASLVLERELVAPVDSASPPGRSEPGPAVNRASAFRRRSPTTSAGSSELAPLRAGGATRDCDPPYFTDAEGIRRVRPGCL